jgi:hypothetical protein
MYPPEKPRSASAALPKLVGRVTSLIPELLESFPIGINGTAGLLCTTPFWETLGRDKVANRLLANLELPGDPRNRSSLLMQCHNLVIQGEASLSWSLSTSQFEAFAFLPEVFCRLGLRLHLRAIEKTFHRFPKVFEHMPAINDLLGIWCAVRGSTLIVFGTIPANDLDTWMLP